MLAGSLSDLQRLMDRLTMVSVNYNMKINTKMTTVLRVYAKDQNQIMKIVFAGEIIEQVKEFCYLGNMISGMPQRNQEKDSNNGVNLV